MIVDEHLLSAKALKALLMTYPNFIISADVRDTKELALFLSKNDVDVVLIDASTLLKDGADIYLRMKHVLSRARVITISAENNQIAMRKLKQFTVHTLLTTYADPLSLVDEINRVSRNIHRLSPSNREGQTIDAILSEEFKISRREQEIISLICEGCTSNQIAEKLYVSLNTVKQHRKHIFRKLKIEKVQQLVSFSFKFNLK
ncbi:LuxR C-terminal-related transcriptional regulator [Pararcticibacter amylolyticus]|uniref:LuxR C-terminal-related transcriptional regulator n=1 Tax=Pararcticibacter amylolyticus TaxID=2173175 RepID=UPI001304C493|nr:response regulator transcription factor [Pararcticibacter amylolyticus]